MTPDTRTQLKQQLKRSMHALMLVLVARRKQELAGVVSWHDVLEKPAVYPPAPHEHEQYMARDHAYALLAQIERTLHDQMTETSADFQEMIARLDQATWATLQGKPAVYPPAPHEHDQYATREELHQRAHAHHTHAFADLAGADRLVHLARVLEAGKPGQFLKRTKSGYAWAWPDTIVYQQPVSGGMAHIPAPPTAAQFLNAILISATDGPILIDDAGNYLQYEGV